MSVGLRLLLKKPDARRIFGERELKIIEKQLWGVRLTQSEKNRLSRDVRKKFEFIKEAARFMDEFKLKKGADLWLEINEALVLIKNDKSFTSIARVWLFGSTLTGERTLSSDIDLAVEFKEIIQREAGEFRSRISGNFGKNMDVQVFNFLPKKVQHEIKEKGKIIYEQKDNGKG